MNPTTIRREGEFLQFYQGNGKEHFYWIPLGEDSLENWTLHLRGKLWWTQNLDVQLKKLWQRQG